MQEERYLRNANLKAVFDCFIDKSLLKCLVVNDIVSNGLFYDVIFNVTLFLAAIFISPVFRSHWRYWLKKAKEIIETVLRGCNKKVIMWSRCASRCVILALDSHIGPRA